MIFFLACQPKEHRLPGEIHYQYHQLGEGEKPKTGDYVSAFLLVRNLEGDTLHYVPDYPYFWELGNREIDSAFKMMLVGDSLSFTLDRSRLNDYFKFHQLLSSDTGKAVLDVRLREFYPPEKGRWEQQKSLSKREVKEMEALNSFLKKHGEEYEFIEGVYRKIYHKTRGLPLNYGDEVDIHYRGSFLNGYVFDDTYKKGQSPTFTYGVEQQLIDGIHYGLIGMKEGESVKIIVPSRRAFGEEGSIAGIVPPYTSVIFDIQLIKLRKK